MIKLFGAFYESPSVLENNPCYAFYLQSYMQTYCFIFVFTILRHIWQIPQPMNGMKYLTNNEII